jgi:hypothetical protein
MNKASNKMGRLGFGVAFMAAVLCVTAHASATTVLLDNFDDDVLGTNTGVGGVGTGFTQFDGFGVGGSATESGGTVTVAGNGGSVVTSIQSNDTFDPTGLTATWAINSAVGGGFNGAGFGWVSPTVIPGSPNSVAIEVRADRFTFDLLDGDDFTRQVGIAFGSVAANAEYNWDFASPLLATLTLNATDWSLSVTGTGVSIIQSGLYTGFGTGGFQVAGANAVTIGSILSESGGNLAVHAASFREPGSAVFDYVQVTAIPEPSSFILLGISALAMMRLRRSRKA